MHIAHCDHSRDKSIGTVESHVNSDGVIMRDLCRSNAEIMWVIAVCNVQSGLKTLKRLYAQEHVGIVICYTSAFGTIIISLWTSHSVVWCQQVCTALWHFRHKYANYGKQLHCSHAEWKVLRIYYLISYCLIDSTIILGCIQYILVCKSVRLWTCMCVVH